jgi:RNA polymerase sigma-70 factor (ECF subfamily)
LDGSAFDHDVTHLLKAWSTTGDERALEKLTPLVYDQLHHIAQRCMAGERSGHTLQTIALVNEVYLQLIGWQKIDWRIGRIFSPCPRS